MNVLKVILPLMPQPYKNIITFFLKTLKNIDSKEELIKIGKKFEDITKDEKITVTEWTELGGKKSLGILGSITKK